MRLDAYITYAKNYPEDIKQDLILNSNSLNELDVYCYNEDDALVDITGATVYFIIKEKPTDTDASAKILKTITSLTSPAAGNFLIEITKTECASLIGNYIYELRISLAESGHEYILKEGNLTFKKSIYGITS